MLTRIPDLETYHRTQGHPNLSNPEFSYQNEEWRAEHKAAAAVERDAA